MTKSQLLIGSVVKSGRILEALITMRRPASLTQIASLSDMPLPQVHKYLASFVEMGLIEKTNANGVYALGPSALRLGLAAMAQTDFMQRVKTATEHLCSELTCAAYIQVWGTYGPTVVNRISHPDLPMTMMPLGTVLPINTATGRVFFSFLSEQTLAPFWTSQTLLSPEKLGRLDIPAIRSEIQRVFHAGSDNNQRFPTSNVISAPVLDWQNDLICVVTIATPENLTSAKGREITQATVNLCKQLSFEFGATNFV